MDSYLPWWFWLYCFALFMVVRWRMGFTSSLWSDLWRNAGAQLLRLCSDSRTVSDMGKFTIKQDGSDNTHRSDRCEVEGGDPLDHQRVQAIRKIHEPVKWTGVSMFIQKRVRKGAGASERWCRECKQLYPCVTVEILEAEHSAHIQMNSRVMSQAVYKDYGDY